MKNIAVILLFILFNLAPLLSQSEAKVMSYNIRLDAKSDGADNWHNRKKDVVDYMALIQADFIGIQEGMPIQVEYLNEQLENYRFIGDGREGPGKGEYSAIFYDYRKWKMIKSGMFWLSETPGKVSMGCDAACHRVCTFGIFEQKDGKQIAVFNTHFDHVGQVARKNSALLINERVKDFIDDLPVVLTGDFNIDPANEVYPILTKLLRDSGKKYASLSKSPGTFNGFKMQGFKDRRIDYVFINDKFELTSYQVDKPLTSSGRQLSDHFPVIATLKF